MKNKTNLRQLLLLLLSLNLLITVAQADNGNGNTGESPENTEPAEEPEKNESTEEADEAESAEESTDEDDEFKDSFTYTFNDIRDYLVVIEHENGMGSGFVAKMDGKYYIFTNQHVIFGATRVRFKSVSGKSLKPKKVELSATRDIARLLIDTDSGLDVSGNIEMGAAIGVFGNSDGAGVATELYGKINGIGGELVEVSADFVSGNSGSPVLTVDREVIGIASYVRFSGSSRTKEGTQFENKTRRFCYRITGSEWVSINWGKYNKKYGARYQGNEEFISCLETIYSSWEDDRYNRIHLDDEADQRFLAWAQSHNNMRDRYYRTNKFREEYSRSLSKLASLCRVESRNIEKLLDSDKKYLTEFLADEFQRHSKIIGAYEEVSTYLGKR